jgi:hypothetical protein
MRDAFGVERPDMVSKGKKKAAALGAAGGATAGYVSSPLEHAHNYYQTSMSNQAKGNPHWPKESKPQAAAAGLKHGFKAWNPIRVARRFAGDSEGFARAVIIDRAVIRPALGAAIVAPAAYALASRGRKKK